MSKPEEIPDTLYPDGDVPMPKAPGLTTIQATAPGDLVTELQAIERCARGRGTPACDAIADRLAAMLARIEVGGGEATQPVAWRIVRDDGSQSKWRDLPARKLRPVDGRGARIEFAYPPAAPSVPEWLAYDPATDVLTIHGRRYAAAMFGAEGFLAPPGTVLRIVESAPDTVTLETIGVPGAAPEGKSLFDQLRGALRFYANRSHFMVSDESAWDTVSGEPQNLWCDHAGTATVEDGEVARQALAALAAATKESRNG